MNTEKYVLVIKEGHNVKIGRKLYSKEEAEVRILVEEWNNKNWRENSQYYLALVENDYVLYDGYADL